MATSSMTPVTGLPIISTTPDEPTTSTLSNATSPSTTKPTIIGIYGISGCGKSYLISQLKTLISSASTNYAFHDGSGLISKIVPGGLDAFKRLSAQEKEEYRNLAIREIQRECAESGKVGVVAGHLMFWKVDGGKEGKGNGEGENVWTEGDSEVFTHMLYLDVPVEVVARQCMEDRERTRAVFAEGQLRAWQEEEKAVLGDVCSKHGILFAVLARNEILAERVAILLEDFRNHTEIANLKLAEKHLDDIIAKSSPWLETMLVLDADRTLCSVDTGEMFWTELGRADDPLRKIFSGPMQYSHDAFRQACLLYDATTDDDIYTSTCQAVASKVKLHPEFVKLFRRIEHQSHIGAVVVTCGLRRVWEMVLNTAGLSDTVKVIGGGRIDNRHVVTASVKAGIVKKLRGEHNMHVWAFGDSSLDLPMMKEADEAVVVVGEAGSRSKTMDKALDFAITREGLVARQALLPSHATPRLDTTKLLLFDMRDPEAIESIIRRRVPLTILHASTRATQLLQTPMRNAKNSGFVLQEIHKKVGWFLATELVTEVNGMEEFQIPHVQGGMATGHRLLHESNTTIIALMRGGEPMAKGVHEAFPDAMFVHANGPADLKAHHLEDQTTILLVDSVVNNGTTIVEFVKRIKQLGSTAKIVVVTGVAQKRSIAEKGPLARVGREGLTIVALRLSDNKYTGKGGTDTGNRLFNTTHLD